LLQNATNAPLLADSKKTIIRTGINDEEQVDVGITLFKQHFQQILVVRP
jgi:hypothetical protein